MSSHVAVFPHCAPSLNMADRRSVQEFVQNVINLQTRSNQRGNNEESDRADLESITDEVNAQFQIPRQGSRGWRTATSTTSTLCQLLLSIPRRTRLFNRPDGVLEGEQETLHQLQESDNQTSCIKIFACFPIPNMIRCHEELRRQIWSSLVSTWTHWSYTRPCVKLAFMWNWRPCSKKPWAALVLMTLGKQLTFYCCVLSTQQEGLLRRHWHSLYYFLVWMHMPLCLNPPSTRPWQAFGVAWRISLKFTSRSSSVMSLKCSPIPTGNSNSCLRRRRVRSEIPRILPMFAQRKPASLCKVCSYSN